MFDGETHIRQPEPILDRACAKDKPIKKLISGFIFSAGGTAVAGKKPVRELWGDHATWEKSDELRDAPVTVMEVIPEINGPGAQVVALLQADRATHSPAGLTASATVRGQSIN